jgi:hypothetical protein
LFAFLHLQALPDPLGHATLKDRYIRIAQFCSRSRGCIAERSADAAAIKYDLGGPVFWKQVAVKPYPISGDIDGPGDVGRLIFLGHADVNEYDILLPFHQAQNLF